jgi:hypothetical protein
MSDFVPPSAGEAGGMLAGAVAALGVFGAGVKWLLNWKDARAVTRTAKLNAWHDELEARERKLDDQQARYQERIEVRLAHVEMENRALGEALGLVTIALRGKDPGNPALVEADDIIKQAFTRPGAGLG